MAKRSPELQEALDRLAKASTTYERKMALREVNILRGRKVSEITQSWRRQR